jgi:predicted ATPase
VTLAREGARQVVLLSGEPGIGKTRLASYAAREAHSGGFAVAWGTCTEELAVPYEPWIGICSHLVEHAPQDLLERHVKRHAGELSRLARNLGGRIPDLPALQSSDPETERYLLFNAVAGLLAEAAEAVPLCVVLDDLHWADAQSLALLKHVLRVNQQGSMQVIATFRDSELSKGHPLTATLADLPRMQGVQRISLRGLGTDEVAEIMAEIAGHDLEQDSIELAGQIAAETGGNPFFVGEILRGLSESGAVVFDEVAGRWSIDSSAGIVLPESVREVIERRIERLGGESLEALRLAAVIGREFDLRLLSAALVVEEAELLDPLRRAQCHAPRAHAPSRRRSAGGALWARSGCAPGRARAALAFGSGAARADEGGRVRDLGWAASAREPRPGRGNAALCGRNRAHRRHEQPGALRGADRARRGATSVGCRDVPRDPAGGIAHRLGVARRRARGSGLIGE